MCIEKKNTNTKYTFDAVHSTHEYVWMDIRIGVGRGACGSWTMCTRSNEKWGGRYMRLICHRWIGTVRMSQRRAESVWERAREWDVSWQSRSRRHTSTEQRCSSKVCGGQADNCFVLIDQINWHAHLNSILVRNLPLVRSFVHTTFAMGRPEINNDESCRVIFCYDSTTSIQTSRGDGAMWAPHKMGKRGRWIFPLSSSFVCSYS